jgi:hypothetical protein
MTGIAMPSDDLQELRQDRDPGVLPIASRGEID